MSLISVKNRLIGSLTKRDFAPLNRRAIWTGAVVDIAGSLVMTTVIGLAAIMGMLTRGESAETIVSDLPGSFALVLFVAAGGLLMSVAGGYVAATIAGGAQLRHAIWTGIASVVLNLAMVAIIGDSGPTWLIAATMTLIVPCAALGGWLAMPAPNLAAVYQRSQR